MNNYARSPLMLCMRIVALASLFTVPATLFGCGSENDSTNTNSNIHHFTASGIGREISGILTISDDNSFRMSIADSTVTIPAFDPDVAAMIAPRIIAHDANQATVEINGALVTLYFPRGIPDFPAAYEPTADGVTRRPLAWWAAAGVLMVVGAVSCGASAYFACDGSVGDVSIHISTDFCEYRCQ